MPSTFDRMSHFASEYFFGSKIPLTFISVVTHVRPVKKITMKLGTLDMCGVFNEGFNGRFNNLCPFSNSKGTTEP